MNDIAAAMGLVQFRSVDGVIERHQHNADLYKKLLSGCRMAKELAGAVSAYWLFTVHVKDRRHFTEFMKNRHIEVSQVHRRNDEYSTFARYRCFLPGLDEFSSSMICIPVGWWLTDEDVRHVAEAAQESGLLMAAS